MPGQKTSALANFKFSTIGRPPTLLGRLSDTFGPNPEEDSPMEASTSTSTRLDTNVSTTPTTSTYHMQGFSVTATGFPPAAPVNPHASTSSVTTVNDPLSSIYESTLPSILASMTARSSAGPARVPEATRTMHQASPASRLSTTPDVTTSATDILDQLSSSLSPPSSTSLEAYSAKLKAIGDEREQWDQLVRLGTRFDEEHQEFSRREEELRRSAERTREQVDKLVRVTKSVLDMAVGLRRPLELRWQEERAAAERALRGAQPAQAPARKQDMPLAASVSEAPPLIAATPSSRASSIVSAPSAPLPDPPMFSDHRSSQSPRAPLSMPSAQAPTQPLPASMAKVSASPAPSVAAGASNAPSTSTTIKRPSPALRKQEQEAEKARTASDEQRRQNDILARKIEQAKREAEAKKEAEEKQKKEQELKDIETLRKQKLLEAQAKKKREQEEEENRQRAAEALRLRALAAEADAKRKAAEEEAKRLRELKEAEEQAEREREEVEKKRKLEEAEAAIRKQREREAAEAQRKQQELHAAEEARQKREAAEQARIKRELEEVETRRKELEEARRRQHEYEEQKRREEAEAAAREAEYRAKREEYQAKKFAELEEESKRRAEEARQQELRDELEKEERAGTEEALVSQPEIQASNPTTGGSLAVRLSGDPSVVVAAAAISLTSETKSKGSDNSAPAPVRTAGPATVTASAQQPTVSSQVSTPRIARPASKTSASKAPLKNGPQVKVKREPNTPPTMAAALPAPQPRRPAAPPPVAENPPTLPTTVIRPTLKSLVIEYTPSAALPMSTSVKTPRSAESERTPPIANLPPKPVAGPPPPKQQKGKRAQKPASVTTGDFSVRDRDRSGRSQAQVAKAAGSRLPGDEPAPSPTISNPPRLSRPAPPASRQVPAAPVSRNGSMSDYATMSAGDESAMMNDPRLVYPDYGHSYRSPSPERRVAYDRYPSPPTQQAPLPTSRRENDHWSPPHLVRADHVLPPRKRARDESLERSYPAARRPRFSGSLSSHSSPSQRREPLPPLSDRPATPPWSGQARIPARRNERTPSPPPRARAYAQHPSPNWGSSQLPPLHFEARAARPLSPIPMSMSDSRYLPSRSTFDFTSEPRRAAARPTDRAYEPRRVDDTPPPLPASSSSHAGLLDRITDPQERLNTLAAAAETRRAPPQARDAQSQSAKRARRGGRGGGAAAAPARAAGAAQARNVAGGRSGGGNGGGRDLFDRMGVASATSLEARLSQR